MAYRDIGYLPSLKAQDIPHEFIFYDTETHINPVGERYNELPLKLGVAIYIQVAPDFRGMKRKVYRFTSSLEFIDILKTHIRPKTKLHVIAHNQAFDIRVLGLPHLFNEIGWDSSLPIINNRTFIWSVKTGISSILFLDTANYGVSTVENLGKDFGFPKLNVDFDNVTDEELYIYCQRDCEILEKFMLDYLHFISHNNLGRFKTTIASQSLTAYRTTFLDSPPYIHNYWKVLDLEREAYHGGRTEAFYIGHLTDEPYYYVDVNSMYPYAMKSDNLPIRLEGYTLDVSPGFMRLRLKKWYVIADVTIETDKPFCCVLENNKLIFKVGRFRTVLHSPELEYLLDNGRIVKVHRCAVYSKGNPFNSYVDFFYNVKKQATIDDNQSWRYISKLFLNSLYGKFGQLRPRREIMNEYDYNGIWRQEQVNIDNGERWIETCWFGKVFKDYKQGETSFSFPGLAGAITATSRMLLWKYIETAKAYNTYYCDTDSLITNAEGYNNLEVYLNNEELGMLKLEHTSNDVHIYGCKDYRFGDIERKKGVPGKAIKVDNDTWRYTQFEGFLTWMNKGARTVPLTETRYKTRRSSYNKGVVSESGRVIPFGHPSLSTDQKPVHRLKVD